MTDKSKLDRCPRAASSTWGHSFQIPEFRCYERYPPLKSLGKELGVRFFTRIGAFDMKLRIAGWGLFQPLDRSSDFCVKSVKVARYTSTMGQLHSE